MGSLAGELRRREAAARAEAERLRARIEELAKDLARADEQVTRLVITREGVTRVLAEPAGAVLPGSPVKEPGPVPPVRAVAVPPWHEGADASWLPRSYQDLLRPDAHRSRSQAGLTFEPGGGFTVRS